MKIRTKLRLACLPSINLSRLPLVAAALLQAGCQVGCMTLNVNVNFPESAVQKATDDYVQDLYRAKERGHTPVSEPSKAPAGPTSSAFSLIQPAYAGEFVFRVNSEKSMKIRDRLAERLEEVLTQKRSGVLGESNEGLVVLKSPDKLKKLLQKKIEKLVSDENADREELFAEVLSANKAPRNRLKDIARSFARSFQSASPAGTWIQDADGKWTLKQ